MKPALQPRFTRGLSQAGLVLALGLACASPARAQEVSPVTLRNVPPDLIQADGAQGSETVPAQGAADQQAGVAFDPTVFIQTQVVDGALVEHQAPGEDFFAPCIFFPIGGAHARLFGQPFQLLGDAFAQPAPVDIRL